MPGERTGSARELERAAPAVDVTDYQRRFLEQNPPPADAPDGDVLELGGALGRAAAARRRLKGGRAGQPALPAPSADADDFLDKMLGLKR